MRVLACCVMFSFVAACASTAEEDLIGPGGADSGGAAVCGHCATGDACCDGYCIDVQSNMLSCGGCGVQCELPAANGCRNGGCVCNGLSACAGGDSCCTVGCVDLMDDPRNCGECGVACGDNETCLAGQCVCAGTGAECAGSESCCANGCVDTNASTDHCGACDAACTDGPSAVCSGGVCACGAVCPEGAIVEGCCADGCFDLCGDVKNCGECGNECPIGDECIMGLCDSQIGIPNFECFGFPLP